LAGELRLNSANCLVGDSRFGLLIAQDDTDELLDWSREQMPLLLVELGESSSETVDAAAEVLGASSSGVIGGEVSREEQLLPARLPAPLSTSS